MIALLVILIVGITVQHLLVCRRLDEIEKNTRLSNDRLQEVNAKIGLLCDVNNKLISIESKLNGLPYKKRQRKINKEAHEKSLV